MPTASRKLSLATAFWRLVIGALAVFHLWLLGRRLADGAAFDLEAGLRWLGAVAVVGLFVWADRQGRRGAGRDGRARLVLWSLVLLLHGGGGAPLTPAGDALQALPLAELGSLALPFTLLGWAAGRLALPGRSATRRPDSTSRFAAGAPNPVAGSLLDFRLFGRPPPVCFGSTR